MKWTRLTLTLSSLLLGLVACGARAVPTCPPLQPTPEPVVIRPPDPSDCLIPRRSPPSDLSDLRSEGGRVSMTPKTFNDGEAERESLIQREAALVRCVEATGAEVRSD